MSETQFVAALAPDNPNLPEDIISIPIQPISLWPISSIPSVLVFPHELQLDRLVNAIQRVSAVWPTIAGRYVRRPRPGQPDHADFSIDLTRSSIPLTTQSIHAETAFPTKHVVQPTLAPYLDSLHPQYYLPNIDCPLLLLRLTTLLPSRRSVLGIMWAHILGDAGANAMFIQLLSSLYAKDQSTKLDPSQAPTFFPHISMPHYPPSDEIREKYRIRQITPTLPAPKQREAYANFGNGTEPVRASLSRKELSAMTIECATEASERISTQDVLSAWWVGVLQRAGFKIDSLIYTISYRTLHRQSEFFPSSLPTLAGNVAQMLKIQLPAPQAINTAHPAANTASMARAIRSALNELRTDPQKTIDWLSAIAYSLEQSALRDEGQVVVSGEGEALVNSNLRFNWNIPFGFRWDQTAFHTAYSVVRSLRVFQANPNEGQQEGETDVELIFNVPSNGGAKTSIEQIIEEDKRRWAAI
ncbi:hypothetical protein BCR39DRAFT_557835 [Naematelia encephala]|uniref:Transferase family-domain-containing protein n=1 Tax=Naematelia encephala TaxID=71784 RepID=A0A1Y2BBI7_9TREE|nr:hypothetical protein BCR39DRAFT_557835 [Naematelia encephala]